MKRLQFALVMTALVFTVNVCAAQTEAPAQITKSSASSHNVQKVQVNKATLEQLEAIPGLGKKKAQAVIDYIASNGSIKNQAQLTEVKGIGDKLAAKISPYLSFN
ncbi:helix-hairpin-helix domain-containing protein [Rheinheimera baltica]|uniref:Helix-hairpin-helix domain-containing protein n=1 Tax=Rheinheimera baltica TaxID=67576 RepID=A0ABT9HVF5_9GAMM|nr:helix-hairpin-helix domain-containing protein [Rheinheimera baltica]MDP5134671.1 helix-hairpin-helix domain-containing protein [Rheinheimera baltica]MDP5141574.1 helix-hairpin-helix domain-containing protein [Rheinheimera baltica]MDP5148810.1 helix-hairpin-helix domain-containing protein [Rheinheimera baltica]